MIVHHCSSHLLFCALLLCCLLFVTLVRAEDEPYVFTRLGGAALPAGPARMIALPGERYGLVVSGKQGALACADGQLVRLLAAGEIDGAVAAADGLLWYTHAGRLQGIDPRNTGANLRQSASFTALAKLQPGGRLFCDRLGCVWGEGCAQCVTKEGQLAPAVTLPDAPAAFPAPELADIHGNYWTLIASADGATTSVAVLPAGATAWQLFGDDAHLPAARWAWLACDDWGYIWIAGPAGLARLDPKNPQAGWFLIPASAAYPAGNVTALALSPNGTALVALQSGGVYTVDRLADGAVSAERLETHGLPASPLSGIATDVRGRIWAIADGYVYRSEAAPAAWQRNWEACTPMPYSDHDIHGVVAYSTLYIVGGAAKHGYPVALQDLDHLWSYTPATDRWTAATLPAVRCFGGVAAYNGDIWVLGGRSATADKKPFITDAVDIYHPRTGKWETGPRLPSSRLESIAVTVGDRLYLIGGAHGDTELRDTLSIGAGETTWRSEPPAPVTVRQADGCALNGVIYIMRGTAGLIAYDTATRQWHNDLPPLPEGKPLQAAEVAAYHGEVWVLGGISGDTYSTAVWRYNPERHSWQAGPPLPTGRCWGGAAEINGALYLFGGAYYAKAHEDYFFKNSIYRLRAE